MAARHARRAPRPLVPLGGDRSAAPPGPGGEGVGGRGLREGVVAAGGEAAGWAPGAPKGGPRWETHKEKGGKECYKFKEGSTNLR